MEPCFSLSDCVLIIVNITALLLFVFLCICHSQIPALLFDAKSMSGAQMRGGGVIHGPVVRSHEHSLNRKVRRLGLKCALAVSLPCLAWFACSANHC